MTLLKHEGAQQEFQHSLFPKRLKIGDGEISFIDKKNQNSRCKMSQKILDAIIR